MLLVLNNRPVELDGETAHYLDGAGEELTDTEYYQLQEAFEAEIAEERASFAAMACYDRSKA